MKIPDNNGNPWITVAAIGGAGFLLAMYIVIGFLGARWLVERFGGPNYWVAIGAIIGLLSGIVNIFVLIKKFLGAQNG
ncbi:AtpZ/AtpI family protein [Paenibacillus woosongensis]|uniref:AtpZ/AtpI family protein n=1 Tax=Paenibacillus woosongensis TaxID=307580 RepID=A0AA95KVQ3_9BACL|nr:AtpZ/AtpI family protein [Paenibacillus woosongensis]WHX48775.1 AtpZ/AtpI family protein [Paenibacillus woosongensis]